MHRRSVAEFFLCFFLDGKDLKMTEKQHILYSFDAHKLINHSIPSKKLLQFDIIAHLFSPIDYKLFRLIPSIDTQAPRWSSSTTQPPTPFFIAPRLEIITLPWRFDLISAFSKNFKVSYHTHSWSEGRCVIYHRDRPATVYSTGNLEWPHSSTVWVIVEKWILRWIFERRSRFWKKSIFFKSL